MTAAILRLSEWIVSLQQLFKKMSLDGPQASRMSVDLGAPYMFHYIVEGGICYLTLTEKGYPKKLAYEYLEELQKEFSKLYGAEVDTAARPYAFIKFGIANETFCIF
jgi:vesicle transport protein SEC22